MAVVETFVVVVAGVFRVVVDDDNKDGCFQVDWKW